ncbi:MAG: C25 family cysteine peptidase [Planctomycetota bacterium]
MHAAFRTTRIALFSLAYFALANAHIIAQRHTTLLVPSRANVESTMLAYLPAIAAASTVDAMPLALTVDAAAPWRPELLAWLERTAHERLIAIGTIDSPPSAVTTPLETIAVEDPEGAPFSIARRFWQRANQVVLVDLRAPTHALPAAALAARLRVPLLPLPRPDTAAVWQSTLSVLGCERALVVGPHTRADLGSLRITTLGDARAIAAHLRGQGQRVDYLALVNPNDAEARRAPGLSAVAALLAAGRNGVVVPLIGECGWKQPHAATTVETAPAGAPPSRTTYRSGRLALGDRHVRFWTGIGTADGRTFALVDRDDDGRCDTNEQAVLRTGDVLTLGARSASIDLDENEKARGHTLSLTYPTATTIAATLAEFCKGLAPIPDTLCLVGWPDTLPMAIVGDGHGIDADLVSDLPLAQLDDDPFADFAYARFCAEDLASATLAACRGFVHAPASGNDRTFATAEWETIAADTLRARGWRSLGHHAGESPIHDGAGLTTARLLSHGSHAMWTEMGKTYRFDSTTLFRDTFIESSGCSVASLDQDKDRRSVVARMLRNGALAFAGNTRRGTAEQELFRSEIVDGWLSGLPLGEANRVALNKTLVGALARAQGLRSVLGYQLHNAIAIGDPALRLVVQSESVAGGPRVVARGDLVTVSAPQRWVRSEYSPLLEWKCPAERLTVLRAVGVGIESWWSPERRRNQDVLIYTAALRTTRPATGVVALDARDGALAFDGRCQVDHHPDGSRTLYWRIRFVDFDMERGAIREQVKSARFRLTTR